MKISHTALAGLILFAAVIVAADTPKPLTGAEVEVLGLGVPIPIEPYAGRLDLGTIELYREMAPVIPDRDLKAEIGALKAEIAALKAEVEILQTSQIVYGPLIVFGEIFQGTGTTMLNHIAGGSANWSGDVSAWRIEARSSISTGALTIQGVDIPSDLPGRVEALEAAQKADRAESPRSRGVRERLER